LVALTFWGENPEIVEVANWQRGGGDSQEWLEEHLDHTFGVPPRKFSWRFANATEPSLQRR
jgi:hypothetical protein